MQMRSYKLANHSSKCKNVMNGHEILLTIQKETIFRQSDDLHGLEQSHLKMDPTAPLSHPKKQQKNTDCYHGIKTDPIPIPHLNASFPNSII